MTQDSKAKVDRRGFLRALGVSAGAAASPAALVSETHADSENDDEKRKARYDGNSGDVKTFYRVNKYPK